MPVRKITVTIVERQAVEHARDYLELISPLPEKLIKALNSLLAKVEKAAEPRPVGLSLVDIENAFRAGAGQKYAMWVAGEPGKFIGWLNKAKATPEQMERVGRWLTRQGWMKGQCALPTIAQNWAGWLAKATSEELQGVDVTPQAVILGFE